MTRRGIEPDLEKSPYRYTVDNGWTYVFNSKHRMSRFINQHEENRVRMLEHLPIDEDKRSFACFIADVELYKYIENRGFFAISPEGFEHICMSSMVVRK